MRSVYVVMHPVVNFFDGANIGSHRAVVVATDDGALHYFGAFPEGDLLSNFGSLTPVAAPYGEGLRGQYSAYDDYSGIAASMMRDQSYGNFVIERDYGNDLYVERVMHTRNTDAILARLISVSNNIDAENYKYELGSFVGASPRGFGSFGYDARPSLNSNSYAETLLSSIGARLNASGPIYKYWAPGSETVLQDARIGGEFCFPPKTRIRLPDGGAALSKMSAWVRALPPMTWVNGKGAGS